MKREKYKKIISLALILLGLLFNVYAIEFLFVPDKNIESTFIKIIIIIMQALFLGLGLMIMKNKSLKKESLIKYYLDFSIILTNTIILFLFFNILLFVYFFYYNISNENSSHTPAHMYGIEKLRTVYPGYEDSEINKLLQETWHRRPQYIYEEYTGFKENPFSGEFVNIDSNGFRITFNQGVFPINKKNINIFIFGGSTTFGYGVKDNETIPSQLSKLLLDRFPSKIINVYNFGRGNYYSTLERILFENLISRQQYPDIAIFIDGMNDFGIIDNKPKYTFIKSIAPKKTLSQKMPIYKFIKHLKKKFKKTPEETPKETISKSINPLNIDNTINNYIANKMIIESTAKTFNISPIFIIQPVPTYNYDLSKHLFWDGSLSQSFLYHKLGYEKLKLFLKNISAENILWEAENQNELGSNVYLDGVHYTVKMNEKIASNIFNYIINRKLIPRQK